VKELALTAGVPLVIRSEDSAAPRSEGKRRPTGTRTAPEPVEHQACHAAASWTIPADTARLTEPMGFRTGRVVDCFRFRNRIGLDVAREALVDALEQRKATRDEIWRFARVCRMSRVMRPYLEMAR